MCEKSLLVQLAATQLSIITDTLTRQSMALGAVHMNPEIY